MTTTAPVAHPNTAAAPAGERGWAAAAVAGLLAGATYLLTLSAQYSSDGMAFARLTREGDLAAPIFFQAEHLL